MYTSCREVVVNAEGNTTISIGYKDRPAWGRVYIIMYEIFYFYS